MMMNKSKSSTVQLVKYLLILPIVLLMLTANSLIAAEREPALVETNTANPVIELDENIILPDTYTSDTGTIQDPPPVKKDENMEEVFIVVEEMPQFWGGNEALIQFLVDSIQYPKIAMEKGIQGRVFCNFVVMSDGSVDDVKVVRGVDPVLDAEAVRVLKLMPNWKPGKQRGVAVNVRYTLPVVFSLGNNESKVEVNKPTAVGEKIMVTAQVQPSFIFPGGENAMLRFIANNIRYPVLAQEQSLQGLITASFNVSDAGKVTAVETNFNSGDMAILSKEVVRVFQQMPDWEKEDYLLVTGKVTKSGAHPLQGATVLIKGTNSGTITDDKGGFQLKVPAVDGVLVISFVGFETQEFPIKGVSVQKGEFTMRVPVVFKLQESDVKENSFNSEAYPENAIVVVGYGKK
jgi:TonB family protein